MVSEWGYSTNRDDLQNEKFVTYIDLFKTLEIKWTLAWLWRSDSRIDNPGTLGKGYILCKNTDGVPRKAFYAIAAGNDYTEPDTEPPQISGIETVDITTSCATILWVTDEPSDSLVTYDILTPPVDTLSDTALVTSHQITLSELTPETTYFYKVQSVDEAGNAAFDDNAGMFYTFTTSTPDNTPPNILSVTGSGDATTGESYHITAVIIDDVMVTEASMHYTPVGGIETSLPMVNTGADDWEIDMPVAEDEVGIITYYITAQDSEGNSARDPLTGSYGVSVTDNDAPIVDAGPDQTAQTEEIVYFDGSASVDNIGITQVSWDFDDSDGIQVDSTELTPSYTYSIEGTYIATLTVSDAAGNINTDTVEIQVQSIPTGPEANIQIEITRESSIRKSTTYSKATVIVTVQEQGTPLKGAIVSGSWSGAFEGYVTGKTTGEGTLKFSTGWIADAETFIFTVTDVSLNDIIYSLIGDTTASI
jgi:PKD repeat protein